MLSTIVKAILATTIANAQAPALPAPSAPVDALIQCNERVRDCEEVLDAADTQIKTLTKIAELQTVEIGQLNGALQYTERELEKEKVWYKQPSFTVPFSLVLGILIGTQVTR